MYIVNKIINKKINKWKKLVIWIELTLSNLNGNIQGHVDDLHVLTCIFALKIWLTDLPALFTLTVNLQN